ncbi:MAG: POTRA domain-containing protein, partial [Myxococcota bacterium]
MTRIRALAALALLAGCAHIDADRYGVDRLTFEGVDELDEYALRACLATRPRSRLGLTLGATTEPECGEEPFRARRLSLKLWRWPWTEWPLYDRAVFERDLQRIERWYRARGYYDVELLDVTLDPPEARANDRLSASIEAEAEAAREPGAPEASAEPAAEEADDDEGLPDPPFCERRSDEEGCRLRIRVRLAEGEPVRVRERSLQVDPPDPPRRFGTPDGTVAEAGAREALRGDLEEAWTFRAGEAFDEARYDATKRAMLRRLHDRTYACGEVEGEVRVDREAHTADVALRVRPGPPNVIRRVEVRGADERYAAIVRGVADLVPGAPFRESDLLGAQRAIFALGAYASVEVVGAPRREALAAAPTPGTEAGESAPRLGSLEDLEERLDAEAEPQAPCTGEVDIVIRVRRGRRFRYGLGGGLQVGSTAVGTAQQIDQPLWDLHLLVFFEDRNFLGGLRRLRVEERPRVIFRDSFPNATTPTPGNDLRVDFRQPSFLEARTFLLVGGRYDLGPDPNELDEALFRHLVDGSIGLQRSFLNGKVTLSGGLHTNVYRLLRGENASERDRNYEVVFLEQLLELDWRDDAVRPRMGFFASAEVHEAALLSFDYVRFVPDLRAYVPLGPVVLAARFRLGLFWIFRANAELDPASAQLGPQPYRLRAGGPSSHRGFIAGFLGDPAQVGEGSETDPDFPVNSGGQRRWEASVELRAPFGSDFDIAFFGDVGDVNRAERFRFQHLNL